MSKPYRRVLLKLSGEVFGGGKLGVDPVVVEGIAGEIAQVVRAGTQVAVVVVAPAAAMIAIAAWRVTAPITWGCSAPS